MALVRDPERLLEMGRDAIGEPLVPPRGLVLAQDAIQVGDAAKRIGRVALGHAVVFDPRGPLDVVARPADGAVLTHQAGQIVGREVDRRQLRLQPRPIAGSPEDDVGVLDVRRTGQRPKRIARHPMLVQPAVGVDGRVVRQFPAGRRGQDRQRQLSVGPLERADVVPVGLDRRLLSRGTTSASVIWWPSSEG